MTNPCPRCGTPRLGDYPICQRCGLDFRLAGGPAMPQQLLPPEQSLYGALEQPLGNQPPPAQQALGFQQPPAYPQQFGQQQPFDYQQQSYRAPTASDPSAAQQPSQGFQTNASQPVAPSICLRCYTPLPPGSWHCTNCGFDNRAAWSTPNLAVKRKRSMLPTALALLGVALLVAALALVVVAQSSNGSGTVQTAAPTAIVTASPAAVATTATHATMAAPSAAKPAKASPSAAPAVSVPALAGTPEPSPAARWTKFSAPDGTWSASFPGPGSPISASQAIGTGSYAGNATLYLALDGLSAEYVVCLLDYSSALTAGQDSTALLNLMEASMNTTFGGHEMSSAAATVGTHPARDVTVAMTSPDDILSYRMWFVGNRFYMMFTMSSPGLEVYPQHFFDGVTLG